MNAPIKNLAYVTKVCGDKRRSTLHKKTKGIESHRHGLISTPSLGLIVSRFPLLKEERKITVCTVKGLSAIMMKRHTFLQRGALERLRRCLLFSSAQGVMQILRLDRSIRSLSLFRGHFLKNGSSSIDNKQSRNVPAETFCTVSPQGYRHQRRPRGGTGCSYL